MKKTTEAYAPEQQALSVIDAPGPPAPVSVIEIFASLARDQSIPLERIKGLMEMQRDAEDHQSEREFNVAFNKMQLRLSRVVKRGSIDLGRGKPIPFARWEDVDAVVRPVLASEGMSLSFPTRVENGQTIMACRLSHVGGHSRESEMPLTQDKGPGRNDMQAWGSGRQYIKRYLACDMLNIVTVGEDTDANGPSTTLDEMQLKNVTDMILACNMDDDSRSKFLEMMGVERIEEIRSRDYPKAMDKLKLKLRRVQGA